MMMRKLTEVYEETLHQEWSKVLRAQKSLYGSRISVLGTGDIGTCFAKRAKAFEPDRNVEMFCEDLENFSQGRPLTYLVDRKKGY